MAEPPTSESMNPQARSWIVEYTVVSVGGAVLGPSERARLASGACTARCQDRRAEILRETSGRRRDLGHRHLTLIRKPCCAASVHGSGILV
jgi:hypothetical protein